MKQKQKRKKKTNFHSVSKNCLLIKFQIFTKIIVLVFFGQFFFSFCKFFFLLLGGAKCATKQSNF